MSESLAIAFLISYFLKIITHMFYQLGRVYEWEKRVESFVGISERKLIFHIKLFKSSILFFSFGIESKFFMLSINFLVLISYVILFLMISLSA